MTKLVLKSEILNNVLENKSINRQEIIDIYQKSVENSNELFLTAQRLRIKNKNNSGEKDTKQKQLNKTKI